MKEFRKRIDTHHHEQQKRLRPETKKNKRLKPQKQTQSFSKSPVSSYWDLFYYLGIGVLIAFAPSVKGQTTSSTRNNQNNSTNSFHDQDSSSEGYTIGNQTSSNQTSYGFINTSFNFSNLTSNNQTQLGELNQTTYPHSNHSILNNQTSSKTQSLPIQPKHSTAKFSLKLVKDSSINEKTKGDPNLSKALTKTQKIIETSFQKIRRNQTVFSKSDLEIIEQGGKTYIVFNHPDRWKNSIDKGDETSVAFVAPENKIRENGKDSVNVIQFNIKNYLNDVPTEYVEFYVHNELFHLLVMNINGNCGEPLDPNLGSLCIYPFLNPATKEIDPELLLQFQTAFNEVNERIKLLEQYQNKKLPRIPDDKFQEIMEIRNIASQYKSFLQNPPGLKSLIKEYQLINDHYIKNSLAPEHTAVELASNLYGLFGRYPELIKKIAPELLKYFRQYAELHDENHNTRNFQNLT